MHFRNATPEDLPVLMEIYDRARSFMRASGNMHQWPVGTPSKEELLEEIEKNRLFVLIDDDIIQASFVYYQGIDPTYITIYDGAWLNEEPYAVLHRVATRGLKKHMGHMIIEYGKEHWPNIRIDTHDDNHPMQNMLAREGFTKVGQIKLLNGEYRIAYQWVKDSK